MSAVNGTTSGRYALNWFALLTFAGIADERCAKLVNRETHRGLSNQAIERAFAKAKELVVELQEQTENRLLDDEKIKPFLVIAHYNYNFPLGLQLNELLPFYFFELKNLYFELMKERASQIAVVWKRECVLNALYAYHDQIKEERTGFGSRISALKFEKRPEEVGDYIAPYSWEFSKFHYEQMRDVPIASEALLAWPDSALKIPCLFFGLCSGHGRHGHSAAQFVAKKIPEKLAKALVEEMEKGVISREQVVRGLKKGIEKVQSLFPKSYQNSGATVTLAVITFNKLWIIQLGDSRAVMSFNGIPVRLTERMTVDKEPYAKEAEISGARIINNRIEGRFSVQRIIGNSDLKGLSSVPKITFYPIPREGFVAIHSSNLEASTCELVEAIKRLFHCNATIRETTHRVMATGAGPGNESTGSLLLFKVPQVAIKSLRPYTSPSNLKDKNHAQKTVKKNSLPSTRYCSSGRIRDS